MRAVGNNPKVPTNIFRIFENALAFLIKQKQLQKVENRNIRKEREPPGGPSGRSSPPGPLPCRIPPLPGGWARGQRMPAHARQPSACRFALASSGDATHPYRPLSHSPRVSPLLCLSHGQPPKPARRAARRSRGHRPPHASPTRPRAPPRRSCPLHRAKRRWKP